MFKLNNTLLALAAAIVSVISAPAHTTHIVRNVDRLNKSIIQPPLPDLTGGFTALLTVSSIEEIRLWDNGFTNEDCKNWMTDINAPDLENLEMYNVTFSDCERPWVICRHKNALYQIDTTVTMFSRIPVLMRSHIRNVILLPATNHNGNSINNKMDNLVVTGGPTFHRFIVGVAKSMDGRGFDNTVGPFSRSPKWEHAFEADSAVPNALASINQQENLAQLVAVALYDKYDSAGLQRIVPELQKMSNQIKEIQKDVFLDSFTSPGENHLKCKDRLADSPTVPIGSGAPFSSAAATLSVASTGSAAPIPTYGV